MNSWNSWSSPLLVAFIGLGLGSCGFLPFGQANSREQVTEVEPDESVSQSRLQKFEVARAKSTSAENLYQQLLRQYGQNCQECVKTLEYNLRSSPPKFSGRTEIPNNRQLNVLIALDSSGSMAEKIAKGVKIDVARSAITNFTNALPDTARVGLLVYGHKGSNAAADRAVSCKGIDLSYPIEPLNRDRFTTAVNSFQPKGYTPIAAALNRAKEIFSRFDNTTNQNIVYLVSDGIETCGGDPIAAARALHNSNARVIVNVIGFDVDNQAQRQLRAVADAGGGEYLPARNADELNDAFSQTRLRRYVLANANAQTRVRIATTAHLSKLRLCVTNKITKERLAFGNALQSLLRQDRINLDQQVYVLDRLKQRHDNIDAWLKQLEADIENRENLTLQQLEQELERITNPK